MKYGYYGRTVLNYPEIRDLTLRVEKLGFESIHINDHLIGFDAAQDKKDPYLEAILLLTALAVETKKIKLGNIVICNSFRNPAYLAKLISTLDNISNGRALLWLGAGWYEEEYKAYGYPFPTPKRRVDELEESLIIYKKIFTEDVTDFEGKFWKLVRNRNFPKPIQKPYPQIVLGTAGDRMIDIACREADGINIPLRTIREIKTKIPSIHEKLKKYNRDPFDFEISLFVSIGLVNNQEELDELRKKRRILKRALENMFIGTPETVKTKISDVEETGVNKMVISVEETGIQDPLTLFKEKIM
ncbi:MAG: LLM class flavin-dependent oxidoreductase [Promethearchaeota archaeon]|jgi:alkanesulfonate monooxygenase SsuD/methylene tetrahydromethanopterin reductase-like flavin-dependent oxidoreductase (luciferase family)